MLFLIVLRAPSDAKKTSTTLGGTRSIIIHQEVSGLTGHLEHYVAEIELAPVVNDFQSDQTALLATIDVELHHDVLSANAIVESSAGNRSRLHVALVCGLAMRLKGQS